MHMVLAQSCCFKKSFSVNDEDLNYFILSKPVLLEIGRLLKTFYTSVGKIFFYSFSSVIWLTSLMMEEKTNSRLTSVS